MVHRTDGIAPDAFHDTQYVFDPTQTPDEAEDVLTSLELHLDYVNPTSECWWTEEAIRRSKGGAN